VTTAEAARIRELEQENQELRRANKILKRAASFFGSVPRPPAPQIVAFVDVHRDDVVAGGRLGVGPICRVLQMAPSTYYAANIRSPSARACRDAERIQQVVALWEDRYRVYGDHKLWRAARRAGLDVDRDQVARLMHTAGVDWEKASTMKHMEAPRPGPLANPPWCGACVLATTR
jgi:hypothetical protein